MLQLFRVSPTGYKGNQVMDHEYKGNQVMDHESRLFLPERYEAKRERKQSITVKNPSMPLNRNYYLLIKKMQIGS